MGLFGHYDGRRECSAGSGGREAICLDPCCADAWTSLGNTMDSEEVAHVCGVDRTQRDCFLEAIRLNAGSCFAWICLGRTVGLGELLQVGGVCFSPRDCCLEAIRLDPTSARTV